MWQHPTKDFSEYKVSAGTPPPLPSHIARDQHWQNLMIAIGPGKHYFRFFRLWLHKSCFQREWESNHRGLLRMVMSVSVDLVSGAGGRWGSAFPWRGGHNGVSPLFVGSKASLNIVLEGRGYFLRWWRVRVMRVSRTNWTNDAMTSGFSGLLRFSLLSLFFCYHEYKCGFKYTQV